MPRYDISLPIRSGMVVFPGDPEYAATPDQLVINGDSCNTSVLTIGTHLGTHIDAPLHFVTDGLGISAFPLTLMASPCLILDLTRKPIIDKEDLPNKLPDGCETLLLKTDNSAHLSQNTFIKDYVAVNAEAAQKIVQLGVKLIGIDYYSIESYGASGEVHKILLENGLFILESINLSSVPAGLCLLYCMPLRLERLDGSPARAVVEFPAKFLAELNQPGLY